jgi:hypothetical protein
MLVLSGCSSSPRTSGNDPSASSVPVSVTAAAVPGGAPIVASPGSPNLCFALAGSASLRSLPDSVRGVAVSGINSAEAARLRNAAADLRRIAADGAGRLATALTNAADALEAVAARGVTDAAAMQTVSQALLMLGDEVQSTCHFPVG